MISSRMRLGVLVIATGGILPACVGESLSAEVLVTQTKLQRAIRDGSKALQCAPKETAVAEANIRFAEDALTMGEFSRGREHAKEAASHTERALRMTDPKRCRTDLGRREGDIDGDGYDDMADGCPTDAEDFDGFEDEDGCPDRDNDGDGIQDAAEFKNGGWVNLDQRNGRDCRDEPEDLDGFEDEDGCPDPDNDNDGVLDADDRCPDVAEDLDGFEDEDGCPDPDNDGDKFCDPWVAASGQAQTYIERCDGSDQCPDRPEDYDGDRDEDGCPDLKAEFDGCSVQITEKVFFKSNRADIDGRSFELLRDVATVIRSVPENVHFRIEGHTDSEGGAETNRLLSQRRADAVVRFLTHQGIDRARLEGIGYGEDRPIDTNRTAPGRARNRRVEFNVSNVDCTRKP